MPLGHEHAGGQPEGGCRCDMAQKNARTEKYGSQTTGKKNSLWCRILNSGATRVGRRAGMYVVLEE